MGSIISYILVTMSENNWRFEVTCNIIFHIVSIVVIYSLP